MQLPFVGPTYVSQSPNVDAEETINFYVEKLEWPGARGPYVLYPTPGFSAFTTLPHSPCRGAFALDGRCFFVGGDKLYELSSVGATTDRGNVANDGNPVSMSSNGLGGHQLFIVSNNNGYILDLNTNVLTQPLTGATVGAFVDGYFLALDANTSTLKQSALEDGTSWPGANVAQRSTAGDKWLSMAVAHREVWLFGSETTDVWVNVGSPGFAFAPFQGAFIEQGIGATFSVANFDNTLPWLGLHKHGSGIVWRPNGYVPTRISTHALEYAISRYSTISDAVAFSYQDQGHTFYVLNFPTGGTTWCYDAATGMWHKRARWNPVTAKWEALRPQYHVYAFGMHLVGDRTTGAVFKMDVALGTDVDGNGIRRVRRSPHIVSEQRYFYHKAFTLDLEGGLGLQTGQGSDPKVMLRWSNDAGHTWSNEYWASAGKAGDYTARAIWRRLGRARDRVLEVVMTDPIPWRIVTAYSDGFMGKS